MVYLSALSFVASVFYFSIGYSSYRLNKKSALCQLFFLLTIIMTIWSFAWGFLYLADNAVMKSVWNKISAFGWCSFEAFVLFFVMILTENRFIRYRSVKVLIFIPAVVSLYMVIFLFGPDIKTSAAVSDFFYTGNFLYNFTYLLLSILMIAQWGWKSKSSIQKKQAKMIAISSLIPFLLTLLTQTILPAFGLLKLPAMGQLFTLIMMCGVNYSIRSYQFMSIPTALITNELFQELSGLTFLTDIRGNIIKSNRQVFALMGYHEDELIGKSITEFLVHEDIRKIVEESDTLKERVRLHDLILTARNGTAVPFHISIVPLRSRTSLLMGLLIIGEDISTTKELYKEIENHKVTNARLQNSEQIFRTILEITPVPLVLTSKNTGAIIYLNKQAQEMIGEEKSELIGKYVVDYFRDFEDVQYFKESLMNRKEIIRKEIMILRKDGSELLGLATMIPSIYQDEEVSLSCIIDITGQRRIEETLKKNNEDINKLNSELMVMNNILINKSIKDGLTNLYNHQHINEVLDNIINRIAETKRELCVMMLDIDYFKRVNDLYGHQIGDKVLVRVAELLTENVRGEDYIGRYGGEEFLIVMPEISLSSAAEIAGQIRAKIHTTDWGITDLNVTISIGLARYEGETANALINRADMLLYQAKYNGRDRIEVQLDETVIVHEVEKKRQSI